MTPARATRFLTVLLALGVLLAACGDDDDASPDGGDRATSTSDASEPGAGDEQTHSDGDDSADVQIAERAILRLEDFPSGWRETTSGEEDRSAGEARIAECAGYDVDELYGEGPRAESPTFVSPSDDEVSSSVRLFPTVAEAEGRMAAVTDRQTVDCITDEMRRVLDEETTGDLEVLGVQIDRMSLGAHGVATTAYRVVIELETQGMQVDAFLDVAMVRVGRAAVTVEAFSTFSPFAIDDLENHVATVVERIDPAEVV